MKRVTITLNDELAKSLRGIQGKLIQKFEKDISFTTIVNTVLVGGTIGANDFSPETWKDVSNFLHSEQLQLDKEGLTDNYDNQLK